eukprot:7901005-Alexandrium_andersonii.AAC.1
MDPTSTSGSPTTAVTSSRARCPTAATRGAARARTGSRSAPRSTPPGETARASRSCARATATSS